MTGKYQLDFPYPTRKSCQMMLEYRLSEGMEAEVVEVRYNHRTNRRYKNVVYGIKYRELK